MFWWEQFLYLTIFDQVLLSGALLFVAALVVLGILNRRHRWLRMEWFAVLASVSLMPLLLALYAFFVEPNLLITQPYVVDLPQVSLSRPLKIVVIGDIQARARFAPSYIPYVVKRVNEVRPDYIFWVGDLIEADPADLPLFDSFKFLQAQSGKYAVLGNHDYGDRVNQERGQEIAAQVSEALRQNGFVMLKNSAAISQVDGFKIGIGGTDDLWTSNVNFSAINTQLKAAKTDLNFLLAHQPLTVMLNSEPELYALTVAGHCHGGQINFRKFNRLFGFPKLPPGCSSNPDHATGLFEEFKHQIFVTPGLGSLYLRARLFDRPEISVVTVY